MPIATLSGSFHRHMPAIYEAVCALRDAGVVVLSPSDPRVVDFDRDFLFVASDRLRSIRLVQDRHLECIRRSSFLWVVSPDGYIGASTAMEIGCAVTAGTPVYSEHQISDTTMRQYVTKVGSISEVLKRPAIDTPQRIPSILVNPGDVIAQAHDQIDRLRPDLLGGSGSSSTAIERNLRKAGDFFANAFRIM